MKLPKSYEPAEYERDIYALWEAGRAFEPKQRQGHDSYSIVMPPPNANANLHIGYELTAALEDIPIRYRRMKGDKTLLLPGADHAGFETQAVYEKHLAKAGKSRFDFSREELYSQIWDFVAQNRSNFTDQMRRMGISADWSRFRFTLDQQIVSQAYQTFKKMWDEGLIYRGERLVNFCTFHGTAFADIEVEYKESDGHLWQIRYPLTDGSGEVVVATTRPETMLGDTAVAVHPDDKRYKKYIGKTVTLPLTGREVPIIADRMVDITFGTGAVKITPAHDPNDYEVAARHNLPKITVIGTDGLLTHDVPHPYARLSVADARQKVTDDLKEQGYLVQTDPHRHNVGHCYKCGTVIEPLLRDQWFIDMQPLAAQAIKALKHNEITFYPAAKKQQLISYLEGLKDWNISRQIAWGIPIPAFQNIDNPEDWIFSDQVDQTIITVNGTTYRRDPDVFDTWFSSSSWPYATLGYPEHSDFDTFYPLSLMETGGEILYPWVSRMIMLGLYVTGKVPFKAVYIHGYVMAEDGSKMSKSLGNVVDPLPLIDQYGSDALRMGIIAGRSPAVNRGFDMSKVIGGRNFCNKLWNIARYIEDVLDRAESVPAQPQPQNPADHWILCTLQQSSQEIASHLDHYRYSEALEALHRLVWDAFADWYLEASKAHANPGILAYGLETILKLSHPFAPFVTETIWQTLERQPDTLLITSAWPQPVAGDAGQARHFEQAQAIITECRTIITNLSLSKPILYHRGDTLLALQGNLIARLAKLGGVREVSDGQGLRLTGTPIDCWLDVDRKTAQEYLGKLETQQTAAALEAERLTARLANKAYVRNAPKKLVTETKQQLQAAKERLNQINNEIDSFSSAANTL